MFSGGCVSSRYINNLQHYFENFEANASKFSQKYEQFFLTQYVTKTKRAEHRAMQSSFFLRSLLQNRKKYLPTVTIQNDSCGVDDFILRQSTLYYLQ